jgi:hypothetical protein
MMGTADALAHLDAALDALTIECYSCPARDLGTPEQEWTRQPPIQATLAIELERVDCAIGPRGASMFHSIAESIKQAVIEIIAAQNALQSNTKGRA